MEKLFTSSCLVLTLLALVMPIYAQRTGASSRPGISSRAEFNLRETRTPDREDNDFDRDYRDHREGRRPGFRPGFGPGFGPGYGPGRGPGHLPGPRFAATCSVTLSRMMMDARPFISDAYAHSPAIAEKMACDRALSDCEIFKDRQWGRRDMRRCMIQDVRVRPLR